MKDVERLQEIERNNLHTEEIFLQYYSERDWNFYRFLLADVIRYAPPGKILDIGCGLGYFLECAMRFGFEAEGIEGSPYAVAQGRKKGLKIQEQLLSQSFPYSDRTFAAIVINQVIEHVPNPIAQHVLNESNRVMQNRGILIIRSPSKFNSVQNKEEAHINLYAPSQLYREVEQAGFVIINKINICREFGLGKLGLLCANLMYRLYQWDFLCNTANCIARKP